jgi:hypothetical protein
VQQDNCYYLERICIADVQVAVYDLADTLCLADGLPPAPLPAGPAVTSPVRQRLIGPLTKLTEKLRGDSGASNAENKGAGKAEKAQATVGFVPPRREIGE